MSAAPRPNPEPFEGSLIWWIEVPASEQYYVQGLLEGYDSIGYYQTLVPDYRREVPGGIYALARITSTEGGREELRFLLDALRAECGLRVLEAAPEISPDVQPASGGVSVGGVAPFSGSG
ncbi:MAG: hypothetical protein O2807_11070 [bacterium]|nr:hypothetical protein [bacterium]